MDGRLRQIEIYSVKIVKKQKGQPSLPLLHTVVTLKVTSVSIEQSSTGFAPFVGRQFSCLTIPLL
jgi:hypothetical protein